MHFYSIWTNNIRQVIADFLEEMKLQECLRLMKKTSQLFKPGEPGEPGDRTLVLTTELQKDRPDLPRE